MAKTAVSSNLVDLYDSLPRCFHAMEGLSPPRWWAPQKIGVEGLAALEKECEETIPPKKTAAQLRKICTYIKFLSQLIISWNHRSGNLWCFLW